MQSAERVSHRDISDNYVYQRSILAYYKAAEMVSGNVLEIGTGSGYGIEVISPKTTEFVTIDKFDAGNSTEGYNNVKFMQMTVPPLDGFENNSFDYVISFQVIEHIKDDHRMISEIFRVLKPGGKLIISTPNAKMSITRNPWHVREYTIDEFSQLLHSKFTNIDACGIFGSPKVMEYYNKNRASVHKITRFDIFRMQYWLPSWLLKIPYDILNRMNRKKLLNTNTELTSTISMQDYYASDAQQNCFDLFYIATK